MTTNEAMPEQGQLSPASHQRCHQKRPQRLSVWHYRRNSIYYLRVRSRAVQPAASQFPSVPPIGPQQ